MFTDICISQNASITFNILYGLVSITFFLAVLLLMSLLLQNVGFIIPVIAPVRWNHNWTFPIHLEVMFWGNTTYTSYLVSFVVIPKFCVTGINPLPGSKRKCPTRLKPNEDVDLSDNFTRSVHLAPLKRLKESPVITKYGVWEYNAGTPLVHSPSDYCDDANLHNPRGCLQNSPSIVEDCLSKGFEGCISMKCSF